MPLRVLRGLILGTAMLVLTAAAHGVAHGQLPDASAFMLLAPISVALGIIAMERPRGLLWFLLFSLGVQGLLHVMLVTTSAHAAHQTSLVPSLGMLLAHGAAAIMLSGLLAFGDSLLLRWVAYMRAALFSALLPVAPAWRTQVQHFEGEAFQPTQQTLAFAIARRGPPVGRR